MLGENIGSQVLVKLDGVALEGVLGIPRDARAVVLLADVSTDSRFSPRTNYLADGLRRQDFATLIVDLLPSAEEQSFDSHFDIDSLTFRLACATRWVRMQAAVRDLPLCLFGEDTGAAAALRLAAQMGNAISAIVSRGGRPDLAGESLGQVKTPTLLIVGEKDRVGLELNGLAFRLLRMEKNLAIVPGATRRFEEPGALETVGDLAAEWFVKHLPPSLSVAVRGLEERLGLEGRDIVSKLTEELKNNPDTSQYRQIGADELFKRVSDVYHWLTEWLTCRDEISLQQLGSELGKQRCLEGIPLGQVVLALTLAEEELWNHLEDDPLSRNEILRRSVAEFFQRIIHSVAHEYETTLTVRRAFEGEPPTALIPRVSTPKAAR